LRRISPDRGGADVVGLKPNAGGRQRRAGEFCPLQRAGKYSPILALQHKQQYCTSTMRAGSSQR
jgi:hypothetical protein